MAKNKSGDILTCDWNPVIGCERHSAGCRSCWYLDGIFPWQQRLGNIPADWGPNQHHVFEKRLSSESLRPKNGIVGVVQHGDLFWSGVPDEVIDRVFTIMEEVAATKRRVPKYLLWTKRAERMASILTARYPDGLPPWLAAAVSVEDQATADERLPHLAAVHGTRIVMAEPLLGPIDLGSRRLAEWLVVGSETGEAARPLDLGWARAIGDRARAWGVPFFVKQLGTNHKRQERLLDGVEWSEFPAGFEK